MSASHNPLPAAPKMPSQQAVEIAARLMAREHERKKQELLKQVEQEKSAGHLPAA